MSAYELVKEIQAWKSERLGIAPTVEECKLKFPDLGDAEQLPKVYADLAWKHPQRGWVTP